MRPPSPGWFSRCGVRRADPRADRPDLDLHHAARRPQKFRRTSGGGDLAPGQGPALGRPVRVPQQARRPVEDPGVAGGWVRPVPPPAGEGDVRVPEGGLCGGQHFRDRTGHDPRWGRTRGRQDATALRTPRDGVSDPERAHEALARIRGLYAVEREAKEKKLVGADLTAFRQQHAGPALVALDDWLAEQRPRVLPKSGIGEAITYATNQSPTLGVYLTDGRLTIDNAAAEQAIRPLCVGRRKWLHLGADGGLKPTAVLQHHRFRQTTRARPVGVSEAHPHRTPGPRRGSRPRRHPPGPLGYVPDRSGGSPRLKLP